MIWEEYNHQLYWEYSVEKLIETEFEREKVKWNQQHAMYNEVIASLCSCHPMAKSQSPWVAHASLPHFDQIFGCISLRDHISSGKNRNKINKYNCYMAICFHNVLKQKKEHFDSYFYPFGIQTKPCCHHLFSEFLLLLSKIWLKSVNNFFSFSFFNSLSRARIWSIQRCDVRDCIKLWLVMYVDGGQGFI